MTTNEERVFSDLPIPPGELLARGTRGPRNDPARARGEARQACPGHQRDHQGEEGDHGAETALELEKALGIGAHFWAHLEADYRITLARNRQRAAFV